MDTQTPTNTNIKYSMGTPKTEFKTPPSMGPESPITGSYPHIPPPPQPQQAQLKNIIMEINGNEITTSVEDQAETNPLVMCYYAVYSLFFTARYLMI